MVVKNMLLTINNQKYGKFLAKTLPRKIENESENEHYLRIIEQMIDKGSDKFSPEEHLLFDLFVTLVSDFESRNYTMPDISSNERIKYLLEGKGLKQKDLLPIFGSEGIISEVLTGKRKLTLRHANELANFFKMPIDLFV
jgi:HTH-type transcriptional regulator / antitoxin HigA